MDRKALTNSLDTRVYDLLDQLTIDLGPPKNRILEAAIEVFALLPREIQYALKSNNAEDRQLCFDLIRGLELPLRRSESGRKAKSVKAG